MYSGDSYATKSDSCVFCDLVEFIARLTLMEDSETINLSDELLEDLTSFSFPPPVRQILTPDRQGLPSPDMATQGNYSSLLAEIDATEDGVEPLLSDTVDFQDRGNSNNWLQKLKNMDFGFNISNPKAINEFSLTIKQRFENLNVHETDSPSPCTDSLDDTKVDSKMQEQRRWPLFVMKNVT